MYTAYQIRAIAARGGGREGTAHEEESGVPRILMAVLVLIPALCGSPASARAPAAMTELSFTSLTRYADPFNDIEVDVVFSREGRQWRVPAFWRGGQRWSVRFTPDEPGVYRYRIESNDPKGTRFDRQEGAMTVSAYKGGNELLRRGAVRIAADGRHFETADGTPFFWLGDTWYQGLSDRLDWPGFQRLTADRKAKGFTVVQMVAGLVPIEELAPSDPGFCNEGGCVWEPGFARINPRYFDFADRRIEHLIDAGMVPALVGAWGNILSQAGPERIRQHWRYLIARYGALPVIWILGGEVLDPPADKIAELERNGWGWRIDKGWTDIARYVRATDPFHRMLTAHEAPPGADFPLQDEALMDFNLVQAGHWGWRTLGSEVRQLGANLAERPVKPTVEGEVGYERLGETHLEDFQRAAFWLSMLNGAAGHVYGANGVWESYSADKPFHRKKWSFLTWQEGMELPGSYQVGIGAKLLRKYRWWKFEPHQEWVLPRGPVFPDAQRGDNYNLPYAAGIPGEVRFVYTAGQGLVPPPAPTILDLERDVTYDAYFWEPATGIRVDLGSVRRPGPGRVLASDGFDGGCALQWRLTGGDACRVDANRLVLSGGSKAVLAGQPVGDGVVSVGFKADRDAALLVRYLDDDNHLAARFAADGRALQLVQRRDGKDAAPLASLTVPEGESAVLTLEIRGGQAMAAVSSGGKRAVTPIVDLVATAPGAIVLAAGSAGQGFTSLELRESPALPEGRAPERKLFNARGEYRGEMAGPVLPVPMRGWDLGPETSWSEYARTPILLLDAYRPDRFPVSGDWLLVLETQAARADRSDTAFVLSSQR